MTIDTNKERADFEAWITTALNYGYDLSRDENDNYPHDATDTAWCSWLARAAKAADDDSAKWVSVEDRPLPACATLDVYGRQYGDRQPGRRVYLTYTGTRPLETTEDEEITHYRKRPDPPTVKAKDAS